MTKPTDKDIRSADLFKLLSSPRRLQIMRYIMQHGQANVTELRKAVGLTHDATCHHLSWMQERGYLISAKDGRFVLYSVPRSVYTTTEYNLLCNVRAALI